MTFVVPREAVLHPIAIRWNSDDGREHVPNYWAELPLDGRKEEGLFVLEIDLFSYIAQALENM